ncbi:thioredoxin family protein [soil metagenome]
MALRSLTAAVAATALLLAGCGESDSNEPRAPQAASSAKLRAELKGATQSQVGDFPATGDRSLQQVADAVDVTGPQVGMAGSVFTVGDNRLAFGVIDQKSGFVYGKTAVYVADSPGAKARGPYPAPADLLITDPAFRSQTAAAEDDVFAAIYEARIPFTRAGSASILVVTKIGSQLAGAPAELNVIPAGRDEIPRPGEKPPAITTDTVQSANGNLESIDTRVPPSDLHDADFADVIGKKPVALLFATPALCASRVCGPVVDIALQLKSSYGDRVEFIHQEVFVDNDASKGLREPLRRFNLKTEPWLFVFDRNGRVTARLEGSFGFNAFERALKSAL